MKYDHIELTILSPEGTVYKGGVDNVELPGKAGRFQILPNHAPIISSLQKGTIVYKVDDDERRLDISGGFVEMNGSAVVVCIE